MSVIINALRLDSSIEKRRMLFRAGSIIISMGTVELRVTRIGPYETASSGPRNRVEHGSLRDLAIQKEGAGCELEL